MTPASATRDSLPRTALHLVTPSRVEAEQRALRDIRNSVDRAANAMKKARSGRLPALDEGEGAVREEAAAPDPEALAIRAEEERARDRFAADLPSDLHRDVLAERLLCGAVGRAKVGQKELATRHDVDVRTVRRAEKLVVELVVEKAEELGVRR